MKETRRDAVRLNLNLPGRLYVEGVEVDCFIHDLSISGARVRLPRPRPIPDELALSVRLSGHTVVLQARLHRAEDDGTLALTLLDGDAAGLNHLLAEEQRRAIVDGRRATSERRRWKR
jgi:PilZ domain-containing protein